MYGVLLVIEITPLIIKSAPPITIIQLLIESVMNERVINFNPKFNKYNPKIRFTKNHAVPELLICPLFSMYQIVK